MKYFQTLIIFCVVAFFVTPFLSEATMLNEVNVKSICEVTMAHDALLPSFKAGIHNIKAGESVSFDLDLVNKTSYIYKNTKVLYKVFYLDKDTENLKSIRPEGALIDVFLSPESYDVAPGGTSAVSVKWQSNINNPNGTYTIEAYVIQNGIHVIQDFARPASFTKANFRISESTSSESPIVIRKDKSFFNEGGLYPVLKLAALQKDAKNETFTIVVENKSDTNIPVKYSWRINPYGKFDEALSYIVTTSEITLKKNSETKMTLPISSVPSNRYQAIFSIDDGKQKSMEIFRWLRYGDVPSLIDTYGVVKDEEFLAVNPGSDAFALKKGERYIAFACLIGSYSGVDTTLSLKLKDEKGNIILSKEETKNVKTGITAFEYPFEVTAFSNKFDLEVVSNANGLIEKATWSNNCKNSKSKDCNNVNEFIYIIGIIIIAVIFGVYHFIKNRSLKVKQNE